MNRFLAASFMFLFYHTLYCHLGFFFFFAYLRVFNTEEFFHISKLFSSYVLKNFDLHLPFKNVNMGIDYIELILE